MLNSVLKRIVMKVERARLSASPPWAGYLFREVQRRATEQTVDFVYQNMPNAIFFEDQFQLLRRALKGIGDGLIAEFGVDAGSTVNFISSLVGREVHGFDSFEGLPENWAGYADFSERFRRGGKLPRVNSNVTLHAGWFEKTLPIFLQNHSGGFAFIHIDCDLYSSTKTIFEYCKPRLKAGTIIVFDEFFNYPNWQQHEYKAFMEYVESTGAVFDYFGYSGNQVAIKVIDAGNLDTISARSSDQVGASFRAGRA